jgi:serine/threonine protein kinase
LKNLRDVCLGLCLLDAPLTALPSLPAFLEELLMSTETASPEGQMLANNRYQVLQKLGEGGMATVYKARDNNLDADVVIKIPKASLLADPEYTKRFTREIRALVKLNHPHVVKVLDVGEQDGVPYVVMQYLTGGSLQDQCTAKDGVRSSGPLAALPCWLDKVASSLDFIHKEGYVHRDVKPANILFDGHGNAYLSDFGIAKVLAADQDMKQSVSLTGTGVVLGTPAYMGPEFVMGLPYDGRIDQYALAVTVFEILAGRTPFEATTPGAMLVKQTTEAPRPLCDLIPGVSKELSNAVQKGLEKDPKNRFTNCSAFAEAVLRGCGPAMTPGPRVSSGMRPTDAPVSQQTVPHGPGTPNKSVPMPRFTPAHTNSPTHVRPGTPMQGTRLSGSQVVRPAPLVRAEKPSSKAPLIIGGVVLLAAVAAGGFFFLKNDPETGGVPSSGGKVEGSTKDMNKDAASPVAAANPPRETPIEGQIRPFIGHTGKIRCLAVEPNGRRLLSGSLDHTVRVWDVETAKEIATVKMESAKDTPLAVAFMPDGTNRILIGGSQSVFIYDLDSKRSDKPIKLPRDADALAFFSDGKRFCLGTDRSLEIWDLERGDMVGRLSESTVPPVSSLFISADNRTVVSGHGGAKAPVFVWDADKRQVLRTFEVSTENPTPVTAVTLDRDGKRLLAASLDGPVRLGDVKGAEFIHVYELNRGLVMKKTMDEGGINPVKLRIGVAFSPDGRRAAMGAPGYVSYQDISDSKELAVLKGHKDEIIECIVFAPDGSRLFSAGGDKVIRLWSLPR